MLVELQKKICENFFKQGRGCVQRIAKEHGREIQPKIVVGQGRISFAMVLPNNKTGKALSLQIPRKLRMTFA